MTNNFFWSILFYIMVLIATIVLLTGCVSTRSNGFRLVNCDSSTINVNNGIKLYHKLAAEAGITDMYFGDQLRGVIRVIDDSEDATEVIKRRNIKTAELINVFDNEDCVKKELIYLLFRQNRQKMRGYCDNKYGLPDDTDESVYRELLFQENK